MPRYSFSCAQACAFLLFASPVVAQSVAPYGVGAISGGADTPRAWVRGEPRIGNASFRLQLDRAPVGEFAALLLSGQRGRSSLLGVDVWVDLSASVFAVSPLFIVDAVGKSSFGLPIPVDSGLVGLNLFAQWVVTDPGAPDGIGASDGLALNVGTDPVLVGASTQGLEMLDFAGNASTLPWPVSFSSPPIPRSVVAARDGLLFAELFEFPFGSVTLAFDATMQPPTFLPAVARSVREFTPHPHDAVAYAFSTGGAGLGRVDLQSGSPTFGRFSRLLTSVSTGAIGGISADGRRMLVSVLLNTLLVFDVEPGSTTRGTPLYSYAAPAIGQSRPGADGESFFVFPFAGTGNPGTEFTEHSIANGQELRRVTLPASIDEAIVDPRGRFVALGLANGAIAIVDVESGPSSFTFRLLQTATSSTPKFALTADSNSLLVSSAGQVVAYDVSTLLSFFTVPTTFAAERVTLR